MHKISTLKVKSDDRTVMGIDSGFRNNGWAIVSIKDNVPYLIDSGTIVLPDELTSNNITQGHKHDLFVPPEGLYWIATQFTELLNKYNPRDVAYERVFIGKNVSSVVSVIETCGLIKLLSASHQSLVYTYPPQTIKAALTGSRGATKADMIKRAKVLIPGFEPDSDHACDAVGVAICHILNLRRAKI